MLSSLKNHPFAVQAFFKKSLVITYAIAKEELQHLIPGCLTLDTFNDTWAFVAVAMVQTTGLRPKFLPAMFGYDFFLTGYRVFVRYTDNTGRRLRGLYILRSETDNRKMEFFGNLFTHYHYTTTDIRCLVNGNTTTISSKRSALEVNVEEGEAEILLPANSPFSTWKEARHFAGPLPFTFTYNPISKEVLIIEGVRQNWHPAPVRITSCNVGFLNSLNLKEVRLASAFVVNNIPYYWKKGKTETWKG